MELSKVTLAQRAKKELSQESFPIRSGIPIPANLRSNKFTVTASLMKIGDCVEFSDSSAEAAAKSLKRVLLKMGKGSVGRKLLNRVTGKIVHTVWCVELQKRNRKSKDKE